MQKSKVEVLNIVLRYNFPIEKNFFLDLRDAFEALHQNPDLKIQFEPEFGLKAMVAEFDGIKFRVFCSGTAIVYGLKLAKYEQLPEIMENFWKDYLKAFIKELPK